jgi:hypothetical protein
MPVSSAATLTTPKPYVDKSRWPVVVTSGPAVVTMATMDDYHAAVRECLARREEFVIVSDARATREMAARERKAAADFEKQHFDELQRWAKALALVFSSRVMVGFATAVSWLSTPPYPKRCFTDVREAEDWARSKLTRPPR